jgi:putative Mn2+ efflux pump MntP
LKPAEIKKVGILSTAILAFSMSTDAFAVSIGKGAGLHKPQLREAFRTGAIFGAVEASTPVIGWLLGLAASSYVQDIDHWIAFFVLGGIGLKMIIESRRTDVNAPQRTSNGLWRLALTALGTSIDSMAVGVSLSVLGAPIAVTAASIGLATFTMVTLGLMTGQYLGSRFGKGAELCGGAALVFLGTKTLLEHLGYI